MLTARRLSRYHHHHHHHHHHEQSPCTGAQRSPQIASIYVDRVHPVNIGRSWRTRDLLVQLSAARTLLNFAWVVDDAKCAVVTHVCVSVCVSLAAFPHYCTDPDVTCRDGRGCHLIVQYWVNLQSVHGFRCYDNAKCQRVLVLALCLVIFRYSTTKIMKLSVTIQLLRNSYTRFLILHQFLAQNTECNPI